MLNETEKEEEMTEWPPKSHFKETLVERMFSFDVLFIAFVGCLLIWEFWDLPKGEMEKAEAFILALIMFYQLQSQLNKISREQKEQSVQLGVIRENLSKLLERK